MDRLGGVLHAEWLAYWRRFFRGGNAAKNNLFFMVLIALLLAGKYISFLRTASGNQVWYLLAAVFVGVAACLRNDGPLTAEGLARFPLTVAERLAVKAFCAIVPAWSWVVLLFAMGIFVPLSRSAAGLAVGIAEGVLTIAAAIAASQIPLPEFNARRRSKRMTLLRKEIRYVDGNALALLVTAGFCIYLAGGKNVQIDAFWVVLGILSVIGSKASMNLFSLDGAGGLDRFGLSPLSGTEIVRTKNFAFFAVTAALRAPILALAIWRLGPLTAIYGAMEAASLALLTLAWVNLVSVRHPAPLGSEPLIFDGLVGFAASALPAAAAIGIFRSHSGFPALEMAGLVAGCGLLWWGSLVYAGGYFTREFDRIRNLVAG